MRRSSNSMDRASLPVFEARPGALAYACWPGLKPGLYRCYGATLHVVGASVVITKSLRA